MKIRLSTINDVTNFTKVCGNYFDGDIDVKQGRQTIDGKSILGIYSLNLMDPLDVTISTNNEIIEHNFYNYIRKWCVNEEK